MLRMIFLIYPSKYLFLWFIDREEMSLHFRVYPKSLFM